MDNCFVVLLSIYLAFKISEINILNCIQNLLKISGGENNKNLFLLVLLIFIFSIILFNYLFVLQVAKSCFVPALLGHAIEDDFIQPHHSDRIFEAYMVCLEFFFNSFFGGFERCDYLFNNNLNQADTDPFF